MTTATDVDQPAGGELIDLGLRTVRPDRKQDWRLTLSIGIAVAVGVVLGVSAVAVGARASTPPAATTPAVQIRTVVVTTDGGSQTYQMPIGSVVSVVGKSCSITVDRKLVYAESGGVPESSCSATVR